VASKPIRLKGASRSRGKTEKQSPEGRVARQAEVGTGVNGKGKGPSPYTTRQPEEPPASRPCRALPDLTKRAEATSNKEEPMSDTNQHKGSGRLGVEPKFFKESTDRPFAKLFVIINESYEKDGVKHESTIPLNILLLRKADVEKGTRVPHGHRDILDR
jgi:hypothetical protein